MNKLIYKLTIAVILVGFVSSCDKGFDDLNINKTAVTAIEPAFILNNAVLNASFTTGTAIYDMGIVQQIISPNSGVLTGANYNQDNRNATVTMWQRYYQGVIRNTIDVIRITKEVPEKSNLLNMARILQAYAFMVLTDTYGEIPYSEAGKGFTDQIVLPKYETQQAIYTDIIKELSEAGAALNASGKIEVADVMYSGDIDKWKRLANSLLLRAGMRLAKVDAGAAQAAVQKALSGGVINSNAGNCVVRHDANYLNANGQMLNSTEANNFYIPVAFVNFLKNNNDPRLQAIAVRYVGAKSGPGQVAAVASSAPDLQIGIPMGYDNSGITKVASDAGLASFYDYTQIDRTRMVKTSAPMFLVTYAQTLLLQAEAISKGWATGDIAQVYANGIKAHMEQLASYDPKSAVPAASITDYLNAHPLNTSKTLEEINNQYWVASFLNGPEAFANFRRSGFPVLTPNPFAGKDIKGQFINRLTYPNSEISINSANVQEAIGRQGADNLDTKVWWHK